jgi:tRNA1Val (adenine37-N6)-methyltransferase
MTESPAVTSEAISRDALFGGRVRLAQPARGEGYRVNVDALLLADFARGAPRAPVAFDLGSGVGAVALALLHHDAAARVVLVEADARAAELARANLEANGWRERGEVVEGDVARVARARRGEARMIVCNPPYVAPGRGRAARVPRNAKARMGDLDAFVASARALLGRRGRACFVYPARELAPLLATLRARGLEPKRMRAVHAKEGAAARVVLVEAMAAKPGGLVIEPPLVEREGGGFSRELARVVSGA